MLFKKYKNEISELRNELEDLRNKTKKSHEYFLNDKKNKDELISKLNRIVSNYIPEKITYMNKSEYRANSYVRDEFCYIYKDGKEYEISNLKLENVTFEKKSNNVVVAKNWVKNETKNGEYQEYVIDLYTKSFVRIK